MSNTKFWKDDLPAGYYDQILVSGLKLNKGIQFGWHHLTFSKLLEHIENFENHLDFACGPGTFIGQYVKNSSVGVDISPKQINYASKKYKKYGEFIYLDNFDYKNYPNKFNIVTVVGLLEFINEAETAKLLENLYSICKPGGKVIFTTPNYSFSFKILQFLANIFFPVSYEGQTISKYNKKNLRMLSTISQFKDFKVTKILNFFVFLSFFNFSIARHLENLVAKITKNKLGNLFLIEFTK